VPKADLSLATLVIMGAITVMAAMGSSFYLLQRPRRDLNLLTIDLNLTEFFSISLNSLTIDLSLADTGCYK
jgi:hypothetical protein